VTRRECTNDGTVNASGDPESPYVTVQDVSPQTVDDAANADGAATTAATTVPATRPNEVSRAIERGIQIST
jgi:hypothetical protein